MFSLSAHITARDLQLTCPDRRLLNARSFANFFFPRDPSGGGDSQRDLVWDAVSSLQEQRDKMSDERDSYAAENATLRKLVESLCGAAEGAGQAAKHARTVMSSLAASHV
jgi:hypothetical protein